LKYLILFIFETYSQACVQRPPLGPQRVAAIDCWSFSEVTFVLNFKMGPENGGRCRQVSAIRSWSLTQVWLYIVSHVRWEEKDYIFFLWSPKGNFRIVPLNTFLIFRTFLQLFYKFENVFIRFQRFEMFWDTIWTLIKHVLTL
jgi:hypothetical protein